MGAAARPSSARRSVSPLRPDRARNAAGLGPTKAASWFWKEKHETAATRAHKTTARSIFDGYEGCGGDAGRLSVCKSIRFRSAARSHSFVNSATDRRARDPMLACTAGHRRARLRQQQEKSMRSRVAAYTSHHITPIHRIGTHRTPHHTTAHYRTAKIVFASYRIASRRIMARQVDLSRSLVRPLLASLKPCMYMRVCVQVSQAAQIQNRGRCGCSKTHPPASMHVRGGRPTDPPSVSQSRKQSVHSSLRCSPYTPHHTAHAGQTRLDSSPPPHPHHIRQTRESLIQLTLCCLFRPSASLLSCSWVGECISLLPSETDTPTLDTTQGTLRGQNGSNGAPLSPFPSLRARQKAN